MQKLAAHYDQVITQEAFANALTALPDAGHHKEASAVATSITRLRLRELAFCEQVLPSELIGAEKRTYNDEESEFPFVIEEMESDGPPARTVAFGNAVDQFFPSGQKYRVYFAEHVSPDFQKNIWQLGHYKNDLRQLFTDNALRDMDTERDARFVRTLNAIVGDVGGTGDAGVEQFTEISGAVSRETLVELKRPIQNRNLDVGGMLFNRNMLLEFEKMGYLEVGGSDLSAKMFLEGAKGAINGKLGGVPTVVTIKRDIIPDNVVFTFAPANFLGKHYRLEDPKVDVKREKDIITWGVRAKTGFTIANTAAVQKHRFVAL